MNNKMPIVRDFICMFSSRPGHWIGFKTLLMGGSLQSCKGRRPSLSSPTIYPKFERKRTNLKYLFTLSSSGFTFSSVQFSRSVVSDSLWPHESQHARPPCPSPTPGVHSNSHLSTQWCHPAISSSVVPFSSCPQSLPASDSSPLSQLFAWGGQSTGVSALASVLPKNSQDWSPSEWTG